MDFIFRLAGRPVLADIILGGPPVRAALGQDGTCGFVGRRYMKGLKKMRNVPPGSRGRHAGRRMARHLVLAVLPLLLLLVLSSVAWAAWPNPTLVGAATVTAGEPHSVYVQGDYAYVATYNPNALQAFDISNPAAPVPVGPAAPTIGSPRAVCVQGDYAYVANDGADVLQVFNVSNPASMTLVGAVTTDSGPNSVFVQGDYAYVTNGGTASLEIYDVSNPALPYQVGGLITGPVPLTVFVQGDYAYVGGTALRVYDVSDPTTIISVGSAPTGGISASVFVQGDYAYVANATVDTLGVFDVSAHGNPVPVGSVGTGDEPRSVSVHGVYAYVVDFAGNALEVFDVSDPASPVSIGSAETGTGPWTVFTQGGYAYLACQQGLLQVFSISGLATYYLAEGSTAWGFSTYIAIENPNASDVTARLTYMDTAAGNTGKGAIKTLNLTLPASSQTVVNALDDLGHATDFSTKVESLEGKPIAVDRTMTFPCSTADGARFGAHNSIGATSASTIWYLPEGSGAWGFSTWTCVENPGGRDASVKLTYMTEAGPASFDKTVPANSRGTFSMADDIGTQDASIEVSSSVPVVAERTMYASGEGGLSREGHCSVGATAPSTDFFLAEGTTAWGFETYVLVQNPNSSEAAVSLTYMTPDGPITQPAFKLPAGSRKTIRANDEMPYQADISTMVHSDKPVVAERAMYWGVSGMPGKGMTDSIGVDSPHIAWLLPSGGQIGVSGAETYTCVQNPNPGAVTVRVTYMTPDGTGNVSFTDEIGANSRKTYTMSDRLEGLGLASVMVVSQDGARPIIVERSMYSEGRVSGTDTIGAFSD